MFLTKEKGRFGRYTLIAGVIACASFAASAAQAGQCPADQTKPDVRKPVDLKPVGVTDTVIASIDLSPKGGSFAGQQMRMRKLTIAPGGVVPWHEHSERPANIYVLSGTIEDYRANCAVPIVHKAGEVTAEFGVGYAHWWKNTGSEPVVLISADIVKSMAEENNMM